MIWDAARPDSSPEIKDSGKFARLEHVIANRCVEAGYRETRAVHALERLAAP
jgi:hypothetical protein